ncbi:MAG: bifunctional tRNA (5-methylaminomethyl-2-thiouridine)(34)-methyltransferase MnmD/FAD-dependent 5-carboxymethylaminomethyl-2-thiouridine(34) oxidoreductase MnmC [Micavibrio sp.]|nr:bifunctional tRNA (5-methylaminomethyl-2-thiouridine)(34)-methyltransferase MnmD/FAD-dependent 5-carboxymethylaminomethyl-2-thiouridine(34) oxidoreductase MnmC [Micavibrio sp.]
MALIPARLQWSDDGAIESADYGDVYFQREKGMDESRYVFLQGNKLQERFAALHGNFSIGETGFGSGLNFLLTAKLFLEHAPADARLTFVSIEKHPIEKADLAKVYEYFGELAPLPELVLAQYPPLIDGFHTLQFMGGRIRLLLLLGDIAAMLPQLNGTFDCWFLDGFAPVKNPDMWGDAIYAAIAARTKPGGTLATFSSAGHVRRGLAATGFKVRKIKGFGFKWSMTIAQMPGDTPRPQRRHIAVIGGGIAGCAAAYALKQRGHDVTIIDRRNMLAAETSGNPVGIVYPKLTVDAAPLGRFHGHAFSFTRNLLGMLKLPSWKPCGVLHLDISADDAARTKLLLDKNTFPANYAAPDTKGIWQEMAGFLEPPEFCAALAENVPRIFAKSIGKLNKTTNGWMVVDDAGNTIITADIVVIAAGYDSKRFAETAWLPLQPMRGQVTLLRETPASAPLAKVICHEGYITPALNGIHCIGATFAKEEPDNSPPRPADDAANIAQLQKYLPEFGLAGKDIAGHRAGTRAATPDKIPMAGPCPDYDAFVATFESLRIKNEPHDGTPTYHDGLYLMTGFGAHGMTGAPLAAEVIATGISHEPSPVPQDLLAHIWPERFIYRGLKRGKI